MSAPVEVVPTYACNKCGYCGAKAVHTKPRTVKPCNYMANLAATTPPQAEPGKDSP